jgi:hypothetical protein
MPLVFTVETAAWREKALVLLSTELAPRVLLGLTKINMFTVAHLLLQQRQSLFTKTAVTALLSVL